ncbi:MAG: Spy/CpxP family protein refolding chaperone [Porticoccaceae bacterium]|nr:Spy/CpxP family protein refolding chaperone [Porticoccaceae bacterium]
MKTRYSRYAGIFFSLTFLMSVTVSVVANAAQIPDPAASQKEAIDQMHHKLHEDQAAFKEQEAQALKELNEMTIREDVSVEEVNAKIEELMAAKTQIMHLRYGHLVEMRTILSDEQKPGYDKAILNRSEVK